MKLMYIVKINLKKILCAYSWTTVYINMNVVLSGANLSSEKLYWCNGKAVCKRMFKYYVIYWNIGPSKGEWKYFKPLCTSSKSVCAQAEHF